MKRSPPKDNVRRVGSNKNSPHPNLRFTVENKTGRSTQCESFHEYIFLLELQRNPQVKDFCSQPIVLHFRDEDGRSHKYIPDYMVWYMDGSVAIHEVSLSFARERSNIQRREKFARAICSERGWKYVVHTEKDLPQGTELANLELMSDYAPSAYADNAIKDSIIHYLLASHHGLISIKDLIEYISYELSVSSGQVVQTVLYLLWHQHIKCDMTKLLFVSHKPSDTATVWIEQD